MAKSTKISNGDLTALFFEQMRYSPDYPLGMHVAIFPDPSGWSALVNPSQRRKYPEAAKHVEALQKRLRAIYVLAGD